MKKGTIKLTYRMLSEMLDLPDDMSIVNVFTDPQSESIKITVYGSNEVLEEHYDGQTIMDIDPIFDDSKPQALIPEAIYIIDAKDKTK